MSVLVKGLEEGGLTMADILIRGMEMPKNCSSCKIICWNYLEYGINGILRKLSTSESRDPNCPLVPLPEGHGRLGDLDALMEIIRANDYPLTAHFNSTDNGMFTLGIQQAVDETPTIVPAEGGGEDG